MNTERPTLDKNQNQYILFYIFYTIVYTSKWTSWYFVSAYNYGSKANYLLFWLSIIEFENSPVIWFMLHGFKFSQSKQNKTYI